MAPKYMLKNPRVLHREKIRETGFMKSSSHSSRKRKRSAGLVLPQSIQTMHVQGTCGKGIEARDFSTFPFSLSLFPLGEQIKIFDRAPLQSSKGN
jgi:hypothetical protein